MLDREAPGIAEAIRADSIARTPHALLSRGVAGIAGDTLVVNLPVHRAGVATASPCSGPRSPMRSSCSPAPSAHRQT